jgi:hypothetical protein
LKSAVNRSSVSIRHVAATLLLQLQLGIEKPNPSELRVSFWHNGVIAQRLLVWLPKSVDWYDISARPR